MSRLHFPRWFLISGLVLSLVVVLSGCYTERKAKSQFGKAVAAYPLIAPEYCAVTFPIKEIVIQGKDSVITKTDTLWGDDGNVFRDTLYSHDTVRIYTTHQLPGRIVNNTFIRTDTIYKENTAALAASNIALRDAVTHLTGEQVKSEERRKDRNKWRLIAITEGVVIALGLFGLVRRRLTKKQTI